MSPLERLNLTLRALLEAGVVVGLARAGARRVGHCLAALSIVHHGLVYASGARLLGRPDVRPVNG